MGKRNWNIYIPDQSSVSMFAAEEFARLLMLADPNVTVATSRKNYLPEAAALWIGMDPSFPVPKVENPAIDDAIYIDVHNGSGIITAASRKCSSLE